jgi:energy-coupling factor transporter ATP-binding protein EcfA2
MARVHRRRAAVAEERLKPVGIGTALGTVVVAFTAGFTDLGVASLTLVSAGAAAFFTTIPFAFLLQRRGLGIGRRGPAVDESGYARWSALMRRELRVDLQGLATRAEAPRVEDVFVDVPLRAMAFDSERDELSPVMPLEFQTLRAHLDCSDRVVLAITGAPGSGKTTLVRHTAGRLLSEADESEKKARLPILLNLRDHAGLIKAMPESGLVEILSSQFDDSSAFEFLGEALERDRCVVMLDGLDEVIDPGARQAVARWIEHQIDRHPLCDFIITSRPDRDFHRSLAARGTLLRPEPFEQAHARDFLYRWYRALDRYEPFTIRPHSHAFTAAAELWSCVRVEPGLASLAQSPLALACIANVHRYASPLPEGRAEVYDELCKALLWRRQEEKGVHQPWTGEHIETPLRDLAYAMQIRRTSFLGLTEILQELENLAAPAAPSPEDVLEVAVSGGVLIASTRTGELGFVHRAFQDYLASVHIERSGQSEVISESIDDRWWGETTWLYAQRANVNAIVAACLDSGSVHATTLAIRCAQATAYLDPGLRSKLDRLTRPVAELPPPAVTVPASSGSDPDSGADSDPAPAPGITIEVDRLTTTESPVVGEVETIGITARWAPAPADAEAAATLEVRLMLSAEEFEVRPATRRLRLNRDGAPVSTDFDIRPERAGQVEIRIVVLDESVGIPLKECATELDVAIEEEVTLNR